MNQSQVGAMAVSIAMALIVLLTIGGGSLAAWRRLRRLYPDESFVPEVTYCKLSGSVGGMYFGGENVFRLELNREGLRLWMAPKWVFSPIVIPWTAVTSCKPGRVYFSPVGARIEMAHWPAPIHLWSRLWRVENLPQMIQKYWEENRGRSEVAGSREQSRC
jgi:hypothetical protein